MTDPVPPPTPGLTPRPYDQYWIEGDHPTANPDGVTMSNVDYTPKTQEEKAALIRVEFVDVVDIPPDQPYPTGKTVSEEERFEYLKAIHSPQELVPADKWDDTNTANLAAGGSVDQAELSEMEKQYYAPTEPAPPEEDDGPGSE